MKIETIAVHGGYSPDPTTKAVAVPIYQTTSYAFDSTQHGADLFDLKVAGNIYTRIMNPTRTCWKSASPRWKAASPRWPWPPAWRRSPPRSRRLPRPATTSSPRRTLYGGTYNLFAHTLPQYGIDVRFADYRDPAAFEKLIDGKTKAVFCESVGNPLGNVTDFEKLAEIAHKHGVPVIVDNTVPSPYLCRPFEHGADIVVHALTKYLGGHGNSIGGIIVDSGKFPVGRAQGQVQAPQRAGRFLPRRRLHRSPRPAAYIGRARVVPLRNMGAAISPFNAFLILQGVETLALRMDRICENSLKIAQFLQKHPKVSWVNYAGLPDHKDHALVQKYMGGRASGILNFGVKGGSEAGGKFQDALQLVTRLVNIGDCKTLACHPATTTHRQLGPEEMAKAGVSEDMIRLSIGIEHVDDLIADLDQALNAA
jgi:O-acetylhomoserine (thiol)-lyase